MRQTLLSGSSVAVYGIVTDTTSGGNITLSYTLDGNAASELVHIADDTKAAVPMSKLFQAELEAGRHVLTVNITEVTNRYPIGIDFVAYNATYDSISDISAGITTSSTPQRKSSSHIGAIVGGVVGGLVFVALCALFFYVKKNRAQRKNRTRTSVIGRNFNPHLGEYRPSFLVSLLITFLYVKMLRPPPFHGRLLRHSRYLRSSLRGIARPGFEVQRECLCNLFNVLLYMYCCRYWGPLGSCSC